ncbi:MAG: aminomethyl-transferring glycine dehydrogenase subunit GcvPB, partial [Candidatus Methylomirabilales bacterium]
FIAALKRIAAEAEEHPDLLHEAPQKPRVSRLNEVKAAREPNLRWRPRPAQQPAGGGGTG